eukprot:GHVU01215585.1.p2 GENE.GHVU01215585.1~~GHVU01215585.1.p2  ORF type:complete len:145 (+),score=18.63 GHVU01215585.1:667-1101(+)
MSGRRAEMDGGLHLEGVLCLPRRYLRLADSGAPQHFFVFFPEPHRQALLPSLGLERSLSPSNDSSESSFGSCTHLVAAAAYHTYTDDEQQQAQSINQGKQMCTTKKQNSGTAHIYQPAAVNQPTNQPDGHSIGGGRAVASGAAG